MLPVVVVCLTVVCHRHTAPLRQASELSLEKSFEQQSCPTWPHRDVHVPLVSIEGRQSEYLPAHVRPLQHGWPSPPQATHVAPLCALGHIAFAAVHPAHSGPDEHDGVGTPSQHGCPAAPQAPQLPFVQAPSEWPHGTPCATQVLSTQQAPPLHAAPRQQGSPGLPQGAASGISLPASASPCPTPKPDDALPVADVEPDPVVPVPDENMLPLVAPHRPAVRGQGSYPRMRTS